jgi:hypothetical protein
LSKLSGQKAHKHEALSSNTNITKRKERKKEKKEGRKEARKEGRKRKKGKMEYLLRSQKGICP